MAKLEGCRERVLENMSEEEVKEVVSLSLSLSLSLMALTVVQGRGGSKGLGIAIRQLSKRLYLPLLAYKWSKPPLRN